MSESVIASLKNNTRAYVYLTQPEKEKLLEVSRAFGVQKLQQYGTWADNTDYVLASNGVYRIHESFAEVVVPKHTVNLERAIATFGFTEYVTCDLKPEKDGNISVYKFWRYGYTDSIEYVRAFSMPDFRGVQFKEQKDKSKWFYTQRVLINPTTGQVTEVDSGMHGFVPGTPAQVRFRK